MDGKSDKGACDEEGVAQLNFTRPHDVRHFADKKV